MDCKKESEIVRHFGGLVRRNGKTYIRWLRMGLDEYVEWRKKRERVEEKDAGKRRPWE